MINLENNQISFVLITLAYWFFMLTDGALRMIVLLHFHILGFTPLQLAYLFLLYEFLGMITNLTAGWIAKRFGLNKTLFAGIILQTLSLLILSQVNQSWNIPYLVTFVMFTQGLSGIAKDLTKMSAKSSVKLLSPDQNSKLFKWVSLLTGSKNAIKGLGFLFGALLLSYTSFYISLVIMAILLSTIFIIVLLSLNTDIGSINKKSKFTDIFSKNKNINYLSLGRVFLFGSRDTWFVVGLPIFLYSALSDGSLEGNKKAFFKKPTVEEVHQYCNERKNKVCADAFIDFYESKDWMVGSNKMKNWKACVRTWEKREDKNNNNNDRSTAHWHKKGQDYGDGTF